MTNIPAVVNPRAPKRMVGCELLNLAAHNPADLVQLSEQQYQSRIDAAAAYVLASGRRIGVDFGVLLPKIREIVVAVVTCFPAALGHTCLYCNLVSPASRTM